MYPHIRTHTNALPHAQSLPTAGKPNLVEVYEPVAGSTSAALSLRKIPTIGRGEEKAMIEHKIDHFHDLSDSGAIFFRGEAGMGKSHLLGDVRECIKKHKIRCSPRRGKYGAMPRDGPLCFITAIIEEQWQLKDDMSPEARTNVVQREWVVISYPLACNFIVQEYCENLYRD